MLSSIHLFNADNSERTKLLSKEVNIFSLISSAIILCVSSLLTTFEPVGQFWPNLPASCKSVWYQVATGFTSIGAHECRDPSPHWREQPMRVQLSTHQEETPWVQRNPLYRPGPLGTLVAPGATTATSAETFLNPTETGSPQRGEERKAEEGEGQGLPGVLWGDRLQCKRKESSRKGWKSKGKYGEP